MSPMAGRRPAGLYGRALVAAIPLALAVIVLAAGLLPGPAPAASPFQWRGVIQGQYGPQFSHGARVRLLRFMARNGFNAYVHAPKSDPYQRTRWRQPNPDHSQSTFVAEQQLAASLGIDWIPNLSPASPAFPGSGSAASPPVCFADDADLELLLAKLEPFRAAGARTFMVSFDDVNRTFSCAADSAAYGQGPRAFGRANAHLLGRLHARLTAVDPAARLLTVTADYSGTADSAYLQGLRELLPPAIEVMWTGPRIESRPFGPAAADAYAKLVGRTPIVWENWTTNDTLGSSRRPTRVFLGPYVRRPAIAADVAGFFFNTANQADLNFLPLATAGDWMRDPRRYRPRRSFLRQVRRLAGSRAPILRAFAEASYSTSLRGGVEAPTLRRHIRDLLRPGDRDAAGARLRRELRLAASVRRLRFEGGLEHFVIQANPFTQSARLNGRVALLAARLLRADGAGETSQLWQRLRRVRRKAAGWPSETFGTRRGVLGLTGNVIDDFLARVRERLR